jgi:hypothetical protein
MSNIDTRYTVRGNIESTDTTLLDAIESALPAEGDIVLGDEYRISRSDVQNSNAERLEARMTFAPDDDEFAVENGTTKKVVESDAGDGEILRSNATNIFGPKTAAMNLYQEVANADLADKADNWKLQVYESPQGGVLASDVKEWYEADESRQPTRTDEDGNEVKYVPTAFEPSNHVITETSG